MSARRPDGVTESLLVKAHPALCEGWGLCHKYAADVYPLDDEGYIDIHMLEVPPERAVDAWMAARACPSGVITVVKLIRRDDDGNIVEESDADQPTLDNGLSVMAVTIT
ncbi:MAG: ferredoxin [Acidimicrobiales bacterium]|nr:ferredoxin [Acidimicrobiales bacterium]